MPIARALRLAAVLCLAHAVGAAGESGDFAARIAAASSLDELVLLAEALDGSGGPPPPLRALGDFWRKFYDLAPEIEEAPADTVLRERLGPLLNATATAAAADGAQGLDAKGLPSVAFGFAVLDAFERGHVLFFSAAWAERAGALTEAFGEQEYFQLMVWAAWRMQIIKNEVQIN